MSGDAVTVVLGLLEAELAELSPGARLPGEQVLARRLGVSRSAVRTAVGQLELRHEVRRVPGSGTYVHRRIDYLISSTARPSLHETVALAGGVARTFLIGSRQTAPPEEVLTRMGSAPGQPLLRIDRVGYIDDRVASVSEEWLAPHLVDPQPVRGLGVTESLDELLRAMGHDPVRAWCRVSTAQPPAAVAERLETGVGVATWVVESVVRDRRDRLPLLCSRGWIRQDQVRIVLELGEVEEPPG